MVGLYVLAISACCLSPFHIPDPKNGPSIDLVAILMERLEQEMASVARYGHPVTTYYQVALAFLGLCETRAPISKIHVQTFSEAVLKSLIFKVDTKAVSALAARCLLDQGYKPLDQIRTALIKLTAGLYCARTENGTIGNLYSTGLAMQALIANEDMFPRLIWRAAEVELAMLSAVHAGAFDMPISAAQLLPALLGRSFLDVDQMPCPGSCHSMGSGILQREEAIHGGREGPTESGNSAGLSEGVNEIVDVAEIPGRMIINCCVTLISYNLSRSFLMESEWANRIIPSPLQPAENGISYNQSSRKNNTA
ncbi:transcobalamin-1-like [Narcine bancroftii]|uniref:transcobalamin-1-like n=1 Tax=Narcine bancroftii TaxID=1343680 RepID=UPI00383222B9